MLPNNSEQLPPTARLTSLWDAMSITAGATGRYDTPLYSLTPRALLLRLCFAPQGLHRERLL